MPVPNDLAGGGLGEVIAAGVCGSDVSLFRDGTITRRLGPNILGHENVVRIVDADDELRRRWNVETGDRVYVEEYAPCGWCQACRSGRYISCPRTSYTSAHFIRYGRTPLAQEPGLWGGFADLLYLHPDARLHRLPPDLPNQVAVLATPIANGLRWIGEIAGGHQGRGVVVFGPGAHGLGCVVAARHLGASPVILVGTPTDSTRLRTGRQLGADITLDSESDDIVAEVATATAGELADVVIDTTGVPAVCAIAVSVAGDGARVVIAGNPDAATSAPFPVDTLARRQISLIGVRGHDGESIEAAIALLSTRSADVAPFASDAVALGDVGGLLHDLASGTADRPAHYYVAPGGHHTVSG
ncbi:zinc-dependent alcohol dehydrogenase [Actinophytocola sp.]|uniref:zinc-dependent alcohol dehydrogenase n=1 Tax=Actinophytocola sp. TaxID=1872138 RepID=UPI003D6C375E